MARLGIPELIIMLVIGAFWLVPIAAGVWVLITLNRIRVTLDSMRARLDSIERSFTAR